MPTLINKKKNSASFGSKNFELKLEKSDKFFSSQNWPKFFLLLSKVGMGNKLYFIKNFHLLLKKFRAFSDFSHRGYGSGFFCKKKKKNFGQFWTKKFWAKIGKIGQNYLSRNWPKKKFIKQSGYGEQTLLYKKFSFIIEKILSVK